MPAPLKVPTLKLHAGTGQWFVYYAGKRHYLGQEKAEAERRLPAEITSWAAWAQSRSERHPVHHADRTIGDVALEFLRLKETDTGADAMRDARTYLARFLAAWGKVPCHKVTPPTVHPTAWLNALKEDMLAQGFAPATINKTLRTAKGLLGYAADMGYIPVFSFKRARNLHLGVKARKDRPHDEVVAFIAACESADERLYPWLRIAYLTACRPIELVRLMRRDGAWESEHAHGGGAVWRTTSKTERVTRDYRYISLTPHALALLREGWSRRDAGGVVGPGERQPQVNSQSGLQQYVRSAAPSRGGMHFLRHSAATHLAQLGAAPADISLALGHWPPGEWRTYAREDWKRPLEVLARVTLPPRGSREEREAVERATARLEQQQGKRDLRQPGA